LALGVLVRRLRVLELRACWLEVSSISTSPASTFCPSLKFTLRTVSVIFAVSVIDSLAWRCRAPRPDPTSPGARA
jgi:hypothetical protein